MTRTNNEPELLKRAIVCATEAHATQYDKSGVLYIYHPLRVMLAIRHLGIEYACCGVLHDVVEDTPVTLDDLLQELGFPASIVEAVDAISKRPGETHHQYLERCAANPIALECKMRTFRTTGHGSASLRNQAAKHSRRNTNAASSFSKRPREPDWRSEASENSHLKNLCWCREHGMKFDDLIVGWACPWRIAKTGQFPAIFKIW